MFHNPNGMQPMQGNMYGNQPNMYGNAQPNVNRPMTPQERHAYMVYQQQMMNGNAQQQFMHGNQPNMYGNAQPTNMLPNNMGNNISNSYGVNMNQQQPQVVTSDRWNNTAPTTPVNYVPVVDIPEEPKVDYTIKKSSDNIETYIVIKSEENLDKVIFPVNVNTLHTKINILNSKKKLSIQLATIPNDKGHCSKPMTVVKTMLLSPVTLSSTEVEAYKVNHNDLHGTFANIPNKKMDILVTSIYNNMINMLTIDEVITKISVDSIKSDILNIITELDKRSEELKMVYRNIFKQTLDIISTMENIDGTMYVSIPVYYIPNCTLKDELQSYFENNDTGIVTDRSHDELYKILTKYSKHDFGNYSKISYYDAKRSDWVYLSMFTTIREGIYLVKEL